MSQIARHIIYYNFKAFVLLFLFSRFSLFASKRIIFYAHHEVFTRQSTQNRKNLVTLPTHISNLKIYIMKKFSVTKIIATACALFALNTYNAAAQTPRPE